MFELELVAPEVITETTQIVLSEGRLIEEDFVLVIVDAHDGPIVAEELGTHTDDYVSYLVIGGTLSEVE